MPGPPPKPMELRQRRNKASTRARLRNRGGSPRGPGGMRAPSLPIRECSCGGPQPAPKKRKGPGRPRKAPAPCLICHGTGILPWHHLTQRWWANLWASPMAIEYLPSDIDEMFMTAALYDSFWWSGGVDGKKAAEIRQQVARFGKTPLDRRRLEWGLEKGDDDEQPAPPPELPQPTGTDARALLRAVK